MPPCYTAGRKDLDSHVSLKASYTSLSLVGSCCMLGKTWLVDGRLPNEKKNLIKCFVCEQNVREPMQEDQAQSLYTDIYHSVSDQQKKPGRRKVSVEQCSEPVCPLKRIAGARSKAKALAKAQAEAEAQAQAALAAKRQAERRTQAKRRLEEKKRQQKILEELKKPAEDMCLTDHMVST